MLMQNFWVTNKEHYGMLWYFLEWSIPKYWSSTPWFLLVTGPHILLVGIPVLACAREEFVLAHQNGALVRKARCDVTTT